MKKITKSLLVGLFMLASVNAASAQNYKYGIGAVVGTMDGVSFKMFLSENLALQADLAYKYVVRTARAEGFRLSYGLHTFELNPNLVYQRNITSFGVGNLDWYAGGGVSLGYAFMSLWGQNSYGLGKFGVNGIGGVEFKFNFPLAVGFDFRPGYGLLFGKDDTGSYFDWAVALSARYCF